MLGVRPGWCVRAVSLAAATASNCEVRSVASTSTAVKSSSCRKGANFAAVTTAGVRGTHSDSLKLRGAQCGQHQHCGEVQLLQVRCQLCDCDHSRCQETHASRHRQ